LRKNIYQVGRIDRTLVICRIMLHALWRFDNAYWRRRFILRRNIYLADRIDRTLEIHRKILHPVWCTENGHWMSCLIWPRGIYRPGRIDWTCENPRAGSIVQNAGDSPHREHCPHLGDSPPQEPGPDVEDLPGWEDCPELGVSSTGEDWPDLADSWPWEDCPDLADSQEGEDSSSYGVCQSAGQSKVGDLLGQGVQDCSRDWPDYTRGNILHDIKERGIWLNRMTIYRNLRSRSYELPRGIWKITRTTA